MKQQIIDKIHKLKLEGVKNSEIGRKLNLSRGTIHYYLNRKDRIQKAVNYFKNLPREKKKEIYKKRKIYLREYSRNRYNKDKVFREKMIRRSKDYYKRNNKLNKGNNNGIRK